MKGAHLILAVLFLSSALGLQAQEEMKTAFPIFRAGGGYYTSQGDMEVRFGSFGAFSMSADYKFASQWTAGLDYHQYFTGQVQQPGLIQNLFTEGNIVLDVQGQPSQIQVQGRATSFTANFGRLFKVKHANSGVWFKVGAGYMKHKIRLETQANEIRQLEGEYLKGYDRLTRGLVVTPFLGYLHMSTNRRVNWFVGIDASFAFTDPVRPINYDTQTTDSDNRFDGLLGIQAGWVLPIRQRRTTREFTQ